MRRILTSSLALLIATAAWGQHGAAGGGHMGGGGAHVSSGFSSGRSFAAPSAPRMFGNSSVNRPSSQGRQATYQWSPAPFGGAYPNGGRNPNGGRGHGYRPYYSRGIYVYPWLNYGYYGGYSGDDYYNDDYSGQQQGGVPDDAGNQQVASDTYDPYGGEQPQYPPPPRAVYQPTASEPAPDQPKVTVLFKDGRAPQQVQNYAITQKTLYVLDGERRHEIPLDQIDLPRTVTANREAGVDFEVPAAAD
jgi:hypothetical protein